VSQAERIKEELGWLKVVFGISVTIDVSLIAWLVQNYTSINRALLIVGFVIVSGLTVGAVLINLVVYRRLKKLENL
jgi:hypothetical protein